MHHARYSGGRYWFEVIKVESSCIKLHFSTLDLILDPLSWELDFQNRLIRFPNVPLVVDQVNSITLPC